MLGSHSDQFIPEMVAAANQLNLHDPIEQGQPVVNPGATSNDLVVIATQRGRHCVVFDQPLQCPVVLFDWTGEGLEPGSNPHGFDVISVATECKGHLMEEVWKQLPPPEQGHYMGFIDDDVLISASAINRLLAVARIHNLSAAQPAVSFGSSLCQEYGWLRQRACTTLHRVPIVAIMAIMAAIAIERGQALENCSVEAQGIRHRICTCPRGGKADPTRSELLQ